MNRDFVDDRRIRIVSDVSYNVRECFRYFGRKIYVLEENLIDIHECLFCKTMKIYSLIVNFIYSFKNRFCLSCSDEIKKILD